MARQRGGRSRCGDDRPEYARMRYALRPRERNSNGMGKKNRDKRAFAPAARPTGEVEGLIRFIQQLVNERHFNEAVRASQALVESEPLNPIGHAILGSLHTQMNRPLDGLRQYELALRLGLENDPELLQGLVVAASAAGFPIHALQPARQGLRLKTTPERLSLFETVRDNVERYIASMIGTHDIATLPAERALLLTERSTRALQSGELDRARQLAEEATTEAPAWPLIWNSLAILLFQVDDLPGAFAACEQGLARADGEDSMLLASLVRLHTTIGQGGDAEAALNRLLALSATSFGVQSDKARGHAALGNDQGVYDLLAPLVGEGHEGDAADEPLRPSARYLFGVASANLGMNEEARRVWRNLWREGVPQVRAFTEIMGRQEQPPTLHGRFPYFTAADLVPAVVLDEVTGRLHADPTPDRLLEICAALPASAGGAHRGAVYAPAVDPRLAADLLLRMPDPCHPRCGTALRHRQGLRRLRSRLCPSGAARRRAGRRIGAGVGLARRPATRSAPAGVCGLYRCRTPGLQRGDQALDDRRRRGPGGGQYGARRALYVQVLEIDPEIAEAEHNLGTALCCSRAAWQEGEAASPSAPWNSIPSMCWRAAISALWR